MLQFCNFPRWVIFFKNVVKEVVCHPRGIKLNCYRIFSFGLVSIITCGFERACSHTIASSLFELFSVVIQMSKGS